VLLVLAELLFFPGVIVVALTGLVFMLGSLVWSMADLWPNEPVTFSTDIFLQPILNVLFGVLIAMVGAVALFRFLPRSWIWNRMVLTAAVGGDASMAGVSAASEVVSAGTHGFAVTALRPSGEVEIDGRRYQASLAVGTAEPGDPIVVAETREFGLRVEKLNNP
jgi:membrane-bound serine protease (ClpP class)